MVKVQKYSKKGGASTKVINLSKKKPPEANMGRQKFTICVEKTAGGQYGTPKVDKLSKQKPPEANMGRQKLTNCRKKTAGGQYGTPKVDK